MDIETRLTNLENFVFSFVRNQQRKDAYTGYDIEGTRHGIATANTEIEKNDSDITDTMNGLTETAETVDTNTTDIDTCMSAITELYEMIGE